MERSQIVDRIEGASSSSHMCIIKDITLMQIYQPIVRYLTHFVNLTDLNSEGDVDLDLFLLIGKKAAATIQPITAR